MQKLIFFSLAEKVICCGYSLEVPHPQHITFSVREKKTDFLDSGYSTHLEVDFLAVIVK